MLRRLNEAGLTVRRADALLLLDGGWDVERGEALLLDDETVRRWRRAYVADGPAALGLKDYSPREGHLSRDREAELATLLRADPPRTTGAVRQLIETRFGVTCSISGVIALMHRLGICRRKPKDLPLGADEAAQAAHIAAHGRRLNAWAPTRRWRSPTPCTPSISRVQRMPVSGRREGRAQGLLRPPAAQHPCRLQPRDIDPG